MPHTGSVFDNTGREIRRGDVLKVFHFIGDRRKRHYMYKQCLGTVWLGPDDGKVEYLKISHLDLTDDFYTYPLDGSVLRDVEVIQDIDNPFVTSDRIRVSVAELAGK